MARLKPCPFEIHPQGLFAHYMVDAPIPVSEAQLKELGIVVKRKAEGEKA